MFGFGKKKRDRELEALAEKICGMDEAQVKAAVLHVVERVMPDELAEKREEIKALSEWQTIDLLINMAENGGIGEAVGASLAIGENYPR